MKIIGFQIYSNSIQLFLFNLNNNTIENKKTFVIDKKHNQSKWELIEKSIQHFFKTINFIKIKNVIRDIALINLTNRLLNSKIKTYLTKITGKNVIVLKAKTPKENKVKLDPKLFFLNLAIESIYTNVIVVDLDSITTLMILKQKKLVGKILFPGLNLAKTTLIKNASLINHFDGYCFENVLTDSTKSAVSAGLILNQVGAIKYIVNQIHQKLEAKIKVVLTGKNLQYIQKHLQLDFPYAKKEDLELLGIANFYKKIQNDL